VSVASIIYDEIRRTGPITFARFMELALYAQGGYYEKRLEIGKAGDFYTSISVGPLFGQLLVRRFAKWLRETETCELVEAGAHDAVLARDILTSLSTFDAELAAKINYTIIEPSPERRSWQEHTLSDFRGRVRWNETLNCGVHGIIFSNELLDAMPMHRLRWNATLRKWGEWFVTLDDDELVSVDGDLTDATASFAPVVPAELADVLPDGFTMEISPAALSWWKHAATVLARGRLVAIDYGLTEAEFFRPDRKEGTARAYIKHRLTDDLLANPGDQDLTAHVNWTAIQRTGEQAGLKTETFSSQEEFLMQIVKQSAVENWNADQIRQLKTLTHPNFLGRAFRVLVQQRA
jgi:SAM-dependent MidA family methyltransferase